MISFNQPTQPDQGQNHQRIQSVWSSTLAKLVTEQAEKDISLNIYEQQIIFYLYRYLINDPK